MIKLEFKADGLAIICAIEKLLTKNYCPSLSILYTEARWGSSNRSGDLSRDRNSGIIPRKPNMPHNIFLELFYLSSLLLADVPNSVVLFFTIIDEYLFILQSQFPPRAFLSLSTKEVVIG